MSESILDRELEASVRNAKRIAYLEQANDRLGVRIQDLEIDLEIMVQTAQVADAGIKERDEYIDKLETKVRELAALLTVMAARHIPGRDPDALQCNEASVKAMQLVTGATAEKEIDF